MRGFIGSEKGIASNRLAVGKLLADRTFEGHTPFSKIDDGGGATAIGSKGAISGQSMHGDRTTQRLRLRTARLCARGKRQ